MDMNTPKKTPIAAKIRLVGSVALALVIVCVGSACCPKRPTLLVTTVETGCTKKAPPERVVEEPFTPVECPGDYACYTDEDDAKIARAMLYLQNVERWSSLAWDACKPSEETTPSPGSD